MGLSCWISANAFAAPAPAPGIPTDLQMHQAEAVLDRNPANFDLYFAYAQMATTRGEHQKAANAYLHMLKIDPSLDRVRLDLGMSYARLGHYGEAAALMRQVLDRKIPDDVRATVERVLADIEKNADPSRVTAYLATGINWDSNANSASDSNRITINDTSFPLPSQDRKTDDAQVFATAGLNHRYRLIDPAGSEYGIFWESSGSAYHSEQNHVNALDLKVLSLATGPKFIVPSLDTEFKVDGTYSHIVLDGHTYLRQYVLEAASDTALSEEWRLQAGVAREFRDYVDAPDITTFDERTGPAEQLRLGVAYSHSPADLFDARFTGRLEDTKQAYYDNKQGGVEFGYTRQFNETLFGRGALGLKKTVYDGPDPLISTRRRAELETDAGYTLTTLLSESLSLSLAYQYRTINASLENYEYDNHRLGFTLAWQH